MYEYFMFQGGLITVSQGGRPPAQLQYILPSLTVQPGQNKLQNVVHMALPGSAFHNTVPSATSVQPASIQLTVPQSPGLPVSEDSLAFFELVL